MNRERHDHHRRIERADGLDPKQLKAQSALNRLAQGNYARLSGDPQLAGLRGEALTFARELLGIPPGQPDARPAPPVGQTVEGELRETQTLRQRSRGHARLGDGLEFRERHKRRRGKAYASQVSCAASSSIRSLLERRSACAKSAALEEEERGYVAQIGRRPGSVARKEKTRFHCEELGVRSAAIETFQVWPPCSTTRQAIDSGTDQSLEAGPQVSGDGPGLPASDDATVEL